MITKAAAIDAVDFDLVVTGGDGTQYRLSDPLSGDSDSAAPFVFDYQYAGSSQPLDMLDPAERFEGWAPLSLAERAQFEDMLAYVESIANIDFRQVSNQFDPTMNVGKVNLPGNTAGIGGFGYSVSISDADANDVTLETYDSFVVYDRSIGIQSGQDNLILHELLHALAFKHPFEGTPTLPEAFDNNKYTILSYTDNPDNGMVSDGFQLFDIAAVHQRWGANMSTAAGDNVYTGKRNTTVDTIWDAGGTDTFDASSRGQGVSLSLAQGTFSSFDSKDDVAIAYDVIIENAIGGAGEDTISGNAAANLLSGGAGNDVLYGAAGNDLLVGDTTSDLSGTAGGQVYRIYQATLGRAPDTGGFANWVEQIQSGARSVLEVATGFVASREFQTVYGTLTDREFVTLLYNNVLEREPDAGGLATWLGQLSSGASRESVVIGFSESAEFRTNTLEEASAYAEALTGRIESGFLDDVFRLYGATLDRAPDAGGLATWSKALAGGMSYIDVAAGFTGSTEFVKTYGALDDRGFVNQLYRNVLDREGDVGGLASWLNLIAGGGSREEVVRGFAQSAEYIDNTKGTFQGYISDAGGNTLFGGGGRDTLSSGQSADVFLFDADEDGLDTVLRLDAWDTLQFRDFGYDTASDALAKMQASGPDVRFSDQGVTVVFAGTDLATLAEVDYFFT